MLQFNDGTGYTDVGYLSSGIHSTVFNGINPSNPSGIT